MNASLQIDPDRFPTFLIVGANKAATSSLHDYCSQHPQIVMSAIKEPMFFTGRPGLSAYGDRRSLANPFTVVCLDEYQALFIPRAGVIARGESSTSYLANPDVAIPRILKMKRDMKIVACLRDPVERAFSCYLMYYGSGLETRSFEDAITDELEGRAASIPQGRRYLSLGLYYRAIQKYQIAFGVSNVHVGLYDDLRADPANFVRLLFEFVGVDHDFIPRLEVRRNTAEDWLGARERPALTQRAQRICAQFFQEELSLLQEIVDIQHAGWIRT